MTMQELLEELALFQKAYVLGNKEEAGFRLGVFFEKVSQAAQKEYKEDSCAT